MIIQHRESPFKNENQTLLKYSQPTKFINSSVSKTPTKNSLHSISPSSKKLICKPSSGVQFVSFSAHESKSTNITQPLPLSTKTSIIKNIPLGSETKKLWALFTHKVRKIVDLAKHYSRKVLRRSWLGQPVVSFTLDRSGKIINLSLEKTSGHDILDKIVLETVNKAEPYPKFQRH